MSLMCPPVVGQNRLARRVFGWSREGSMMEATPGLPCLNLKSSENCHRCCTRCASPLFDLLRARFAEQQELCSSGGTHMRFPISHENGEQGHALDYVCCGFSFSYSAHQNHFDHNLVSPVHDAGVSDGFDFKHFQYNEVSPSSYPCSI